MKICNSSGKSSVVCVVSGTQGLQKNCRFLFIVLSYVPERRWNNKVCFKKKSVLDANRTRSLGGPTSPGKSILGSSTSQANK